MAHKKAPKNIMDPDYWYIEGIKYDLSSFHDEHPGGPWAIELGRGRECIGLIASYHPKIPREMMKKFRCPEEEQDVLHAGYQYPPNGKFTFEKDGFYQQLKDEVFGEFKKKGIHWKFDWPHKLYTLFCILSLPTCFWIMASYANSGFVGMALLFSVLHGIFRANIVTQMTHGASHFAFSTNPYVNRWMYRLGTVLIALWSPNSWDIQHVVAHHIYTNEWPYDSDSAFPIKSIGHEQRRYWYHKFQHYYMMMVYTFTIPLVQLNSIKELLTLKQVTFTIRYPFWSSKIEHWGTHIGMFLYMITPLFICNSFIQGFYLMILSNIVSSLIFALQFVINHEVDDIFIGERYANKLLDWGEYQVLESSSFSIESKFWLELSGGLNTQIEHHLFPGIAYQYYADIAKIVEKRCKERGIRYTKKATLWEGLKSHWRLLANPPKSSRKED